MISKEDITKFISEKLEELNIFVVDIQTNTQNKLKVFLDSDEGVSIDKCVIISKAIESSLDRDVEDFELEVSSYGLLSPFVLPLHFKKNIDKEVKVVKTDGVLEKGILKSFELSDDKETVLSVDLMQENDDLGYDFNIQEESLAIIKIKNQEIKNISLVSAF